MEKSRKITIGLACFYGIILTWIILFKMQFSVKDLQGIRNINMVPFGESVIINGKIDLDEIMGNVIIFIPLGLYLSMLKKEWKWHKKVGLIAGVSLIFEILQYVFAIGATDITDLITNTLGGMLGLGIYEILKKIVKSKTNRVLNSLGILGSILVFLFLLLLIVMN